MLNYLVATHLLQPVARLVDRLPAAELVDLPHQAGLFLLQRGVVLQVVRVVGLERLNCQGQLLCPEVEGVQE